VLANGTGGDIGGSGVISCVTVSQSVCRPVAQLGHVCRRASGWLAGVQCDRYAGITSPKLFVAYCDLQRFFVNTYTHSLTHLDCVYLSVVVSS